MMSWSIRRQLGGMPAAGTAAADGQGTYGRLLPTGRLEAFSDGVFAIAITLLVLELHVPTGHEALLRGLEHEWPRYLGYFVSFAFIGGVWIAHSNLTRFIKAADADLLRLNTAIVPGPTGPCPATPNRLGALGGDLCGYPNGRRLGDDVIDIDLRAIAQGYGSFLNGLLGLPNKSPNNIVGDGVDQNDVPFASTFPYVASPHQGYEVP